MAPAAARIVRPHPGPLPRGEGESHPAFGRIHDLGFAEFSGSSHPDVGGGDAPNGVSAGGTPLPPLLGERAGVRADVSASSNSPISDFTLWQLADSAFPTGGFAHSNGLEAAWQHGEVRNRAELHSFLETGLHQLGRAALPFVTAAHAAPERLGEFDALCDAFTANHVANRASRAQGRAFLTAVERIFLERGVHAASSVIGERMLQRPEGRAPAPPPFAHFAPVFGACLGGLGVARGTALRMFFFNHLRATLAAAVRLNVAGPMEAQRLQHRLAPLAEATLQRCESLTLDDLAQTSPLLELWQGAHDRLYSRLFQS
jgi:urease accessory protein